MKVFKLNKSVKNLTAIILILFSVMALNINAQEKVLVDFGKLEYMQDQNMDYLKQIHRIIKDYPAFSYTYKIEKGKFKEARVLGVEDPQDKKRLEVLLLDLNSNKNMLKGKASRIGVFYSVDKEPQYKQGKEALQNTLRENLKYPKNAKNWGIEGTVFVNFVVDENGNIPFATTSEDIETPAVDIYVDEMKMQAIEAIKATSGNWKPGEINGVIVPSLAIVPITFDFRKNPMLPALL